VTSRIRTSHSERTAVPFLAKGGNDAVELGQALPSAEEINEAAFARSQDSCSARRPKHSTAGDATSHSSPDPDPLVGVAAVDETGWMQFRFGGVEATGPAEEASELTRPGTGYA
jgi:hypothetical protein